MGLKTTSPRKQKQPSQRRNAVDHRIGLVAGWGEFPVKVARSLSEQGKEVHCCAILDHASPELESICSSYRVFGMGQMGRQAKYLRRQGVKQATMAGKIFKTMLFQKVWSLFWHFPDLSFLRHFYPIFFSQTKDWRDDTLLLTVIELYESHGIQFAPATDLAPELLVNAGVLTRKCPNKSELKDIRFGWQIAKQMGGLDIGQTVVVKNQAIIAVEAIEGTDSCIRRAGSLSQRGFTVVKVAKPNQDMRFDVPTIGPGTIRSVHEAGGNVLAIEAGKSILLDAEETVDLADELGIAIIATDETKL